MNNMEWELPEEFETDDALEDHIRRLMERAEIEERLMERVERLEQELAIEELAAEIHVVNRAKGFWNEPEMMDKYAAKMMLVVTETAEVVEALRKSQGKDKVTEEFADIFIRALDLYHVLVQAGEADPRLYKVILDKVETNRTRPPKHGNRWG